MMIGIISDTHGVLREEVVVHLKKCDVILHAGDFHTLSVFEALESIAPLYAVRGNNDHGGWAEKLPETISFELGHYRFYMAHQRKDVQITNEEADFIIVGHSHAYMERREENCIWLNPGGCGRKRFKLDLTMAVIEIKDNVIQITKIVL